MASEDYGVQTPDHPWDELLAYSQGLAYKMRLFYPVVPLGAKFCQWPGSIKVQLILLDNKVLTAIRLADGSVRCSGM